MSNRKIRLIRLSSEESADIIIQEGGEIRRPVTKPEGWEGHVIHCSSPDVEGSTVACARDGRHGPRHTPPPLPNCKRYGTSSL